MDIAGDDLLAVAREAVQTHLAGLPAVRYDDGPKSGVFVSIYGRRGLRGCIGYVYPDMPLSMTLADAAVAAATKDPRFSPMQYSELCDVRFEVTILDKPEIIHASTPQDYIRMIRPGRDGVMIQHGDASGLLLPQVATVMGWSALELLQNTCLKAGLDRDKWQDKHTDVYRFGGRVFSE